MAGRVLPSFLSTVWQDTERSLLVYLSGGMGQGCVRMTAGAHRGLRGPGTGVSTVVLLDMGAGNQAQVP